MVKLAAEDVERNRGRTDDPRYRRLGLPVGSSPAGPLIKQVNLRVTGTEPSRLGGGLAAVRQVRAAYLSDDGRAGAFHQRRPRGPAAGRNRAKLVQPET